jgi:hypothetical protein
LASGQVAGDEWLADPEAQAGKIVNKSVPFREIPFREMHRGQEPWRASRSRGTVEEVKPS